MKAKWLPVIVFGLAHILIITFLFNRGVYGERYTAAGVFFDYASCVFQGQLVYRDFAMEYPPLALVFFILPRSIAASYDAYTIAFTVEILIFDLIGLVLAAAMSRRLNQSIWGTLTIYTLALLAIGPIILDRYDLVPAVMVLLALYAFSLGKLKISWALLAVGTMTKIYPAVLAPIFLIDSLCRRQYRQSLAGVITFTAIIVVIILPFLWLSPARLWDFTGYHIQRGLQLESVYASCLLLGHTLGLTVVRPEFSFGAWNIVSPMADALAMASMVVMLLSLLVVYWFFFKQRGLSNQSRMPLVVNFSLLAVLAAMVTSKFLSPQFIIWLYPLVPLVSGRWRYVSGILLIFIGLSTHFIFPAHYIELIHLEPAPIYILLVRNIMLFALGGLVFSTGEGGVYVRGVCTPLHAPKICRT